MQKYLAGVIEENKGGITMEVREKIKEKMEIVKKMGDCLVSKAKDDGILDEWNAELESSVPSIVIVTWNTGYPEVHEIIPHLDENGLEWMSVHNGDEYDWDWVTKNITEYGYCDKDDTLDVLEQIIQVCCEILSEEKYYLLCPKCMEISNGEDWTDTWQELREYTGKIGYKPLDDEIGWDVLPKPTGEPQDAEHKYTEHKCGFLSENYHSSEFMICLKGNTVIDTGAYWETFTKDLEEIAKEKGWEIKLD